MKIIAIVTSKKEFHSNCHYLHQNLFAFKLLCLQVTVIHAFNLNPEWSHVSGLDSFMVCDVIKTTRSTDIFFSELYQQTKFLLVIITICYLLSCLKV